MAIERLLSSRDQPLKRPVLVYLERLLLTQSGRSSDSTSSAWCYASRSN